MPVPTHREGCQTMMVCKDPNTGKVLRVRYETVGTIKLTTVEESFAEGSVVSGSGFQVGDMVE